MWYFRQHSGGVLSEATPVCVGYSGHGLGRNNPAAQAEPDIGPIPRGRYTIGPPQPTHGGFALPLTPDPSNEMFGRSAFLIHGDMANPALAGTASLGCIIIPRVYRWAIWGSGDHDLEVLE